jgi:hypothetical protein
LNKQQLLQWAAYTVFLLRNTCPLVLLLEERVIRAQGADLESPCTPAHTHHKCNTMAEAESKSNRLEGDLPDINSEKEIWNLKPLEKHALCTYGAFHQPFQFWN